MKAGGRYHIDLIYESRNKHAVSLPMYNVRASAICTICAADMRNLENFSTIFCNRDFVAQDIQKKDSPFASEAHKVHAPAVPDAAAGQDQWYYLDPAAKIQVETSLPALLCDC